LTRTEVLQSNSCEMCAATGFPQRRVFLQDESNRSAPQSLITIQFMYRRSSRVAPTI
jgi:hypothetical protein